MVNHPARPLNPFYFGLYGGSDLPGFLLSDAAAAPFFEANDYRVAATTLVLQRRLDRPLAVADPRFAATRRKFDVKILPRNAVVSHHEVAFRGLCPDCAKRKPGLKRKTQS